MEMMLLLTTITFISMASQLLMEQQNCLDAGNSSLDYRRRLRFENNSVMVYADNHNHLAHIINQKATEN